MRPFSPRMGFSFFSQTTECPSKEAIVFKEKTPNQKWSQLIPYQTRANTAPMSVASARSVFKLSLMIQSLS
jgi:hypothetical protein